jgi:hypothetical protein
MNKMELYMKNETLVPTAVYYAGYNRIAAKASVGDGWAGLIDKVFDKMEDMQSHAIVVPRIVQVKEKWGGLRIYADNYIKEFEDFIIEIEKQSFTICEVCGKDGHLRGGGWYNTLCDKHAQGRKVIEEL